MRPKRAVAYLEAKKIGNRTYYYLIERGRVNGVSKKVRTVYLGTAEGILARIQGQAPTSPLVLKSYPFGKTALLLKTAQKLDFVETVDHYAHKRSTPGLSVGQYLLLTILARAHQPWSKAATGRWFSRDCYLKFLWDVPHRLTSRNILANLRHLADPQVQRRIEMALAEKLVKRGLRPSTLFWDVTNTSNYIEEGEELPRTGFAKDRRYDLNQVSTGLVVTEDHVPFFHETLPGNCDEYEVFSKAVEALTVRLTRLELDPSEMILVMDRGANSEENLAKARELMHVVGGVPSHLVPDLMELDPTDFTPLHVTGRGNELLGHLTRREIYGQEWNVAVVYNAATARRRAEAYARYERRFVAGIQKLKEGYERTKGRPMTYSRAAAQAAALVFEPYRTVFRYTLSENPHTFTWEVDPVAKERLHRRFGKRVLFTDLDLDAAAMVRTYEERGKVEEDFRWMKGDEMMPFAPLFVRKDESIRAHAFMTVMGLLLWRLAFTEMRRHGVKESEGEILDALEELRLVLQAQGRGGKLRGGKWALEQHDPLAHELLETLDLKALVPA